MAFGNIIIRSPYTPYSIYLKKGLYMVPLWFGAGTSAQTPPPRHACLKLKSTLNWKSNSIGSSFRVYSGLGRGPDSKHSTPNAEALHSEP